MKSKLNLEIAFGIDHQYCENARCRYLFGKINEGWKKIVEIFCFYLNYS
ncbi:MAG: hypothetical protein ACI92E_002620 [Oceanicoccus sp.]|jgi:hypothetical protein